MNGTSAGVCGVGSPTTDDGPFPLFAGIGVELEFMIVAADTLDVLPVADQLIQTVAGACVSDVSRGDLAWSNELVLHVIEIKTNGPASNLDGLAEQFQSEVRLLNQRLGALGARLMPAGMHPWMNPAKETCLWPHENAEIYNAFDRIFDCHRHGWGNLQSMHLNLPFADDEEFGRLHAAIRLVLPLLPALAASSPLQDGQPTDFLDNRLRAYSSNCARIPSIAGRIIPEPFFTRPEYEARILRPMFQAIEPHDPEGILRQEFLNARGAIARFTRQSIEIRIIDMQECPATDLAIAAAAIAVIKALVDERWSNLAQQQSFGVDRLERILRATMAQAGGALIGDREFLRVYGLRHAGCLSAERLWRHLLNQVALPESNDRSRWLESLELILNHGCLARRILRSLRGGRSKCHLHAVYERLCECLSAGVGFLA